MHSIPKYDVRQFLNIINEASDPLDAALLTIGNYIQHNQPTDLASAADVLKQHGYKEVFNGGKYFRALFHDITPDDKARFSTVGELYASVVQDIRMDLSKGEQGFTTSLDNAINFVNGTLWHAASRPEHRPNDPIEPLNSLIVVYEVEAPANSVICSMRGLKAFLTQTPQTGYGWRVLNDSINDLWDGYGSDDEVVIDTRAGVRVIATHLFDSEEHDPDR